MYLLTGVWHIGFALRNRAWARALAWACVTACGCITIFYLNQTITKPDSKQYVFFDFRLLIAAAYMGVLNLWLSGLAKPARQSLRRWLKGAWTGITRARMTRAGAGGSTYELANMADQMG